MLIKNYLILIHGGGEFMQKNIQIEQNVVFGQTDREYLTADVYRPYEGEDLPAVILIHGGAFQSGSKEMYREWGSYLAESGFVAMAINYRLATFTYSTWPGVLDDVRSAVNWLVSKSNEWKIEPQRIGLIGDSAGAHLAAHFSLIAPANASFKIRAVIGVYGVYDLEQECETSQRDKKLNEKMMGVAFPEARKEFRKASPIHHIKEAVSNSIFDTSYFIIWGETDPVVHPSQSVDFAQKLMEEGVDTKRLAIQDKGHFWLNLIPGVEGGTMKDYPNTEVAPEVLGFLKEKLCVPVVGNFSLAGAKQIQEISKSVLY